MRGLLASIILFMLCPSATLIPQAQKKTLPARPLVQQIAGIRIGPHRSTDGDVVKLLGQGYYTRHEGHGGGRYYTDLNRQITFHIEIGVDRLIDTVELTKGFDIPYKMAPNETRFLAKALAALPAIDKNLRLGMQAEAIILKLGKPNEDAKEGNKRTLVYTIDFEKDPRVGLFYEATFKFINNRLVKIKLYDGE
jgi:hypothetical protein